MTQLAEHAHHRASDDTQYKLGQNDATIALILASQRRMEIQIDGIMGKLAEQKGERRMTVWAAGVVGSALMFLLAIVGKKLGITP